MARKNSALLLLFSTLIQSTLLPNKSDLIKQVYRIIVQLYYSLTFWEERLKIHRNFFLAYLRRAPTINYAGKRASHSVRKMKVVVCNRVTIRLSTKVPIVVFLLKRRKNRNMGKPLLSHFIILYRFLVALLTPLTQHEFHSCRGLKKSKCIAEVYVI